jgi:hypothetical protein
MCDEMGIPLLVQLPHDPELARSVDDGTEYLEKHMDSPVGRKFAQLAAILFDKLGTFIVFFHFHFKKLLSEL